MDGLAHRSSVRKQEIHWDLKGGCDSCEKQLSLNELGMNGANEVLEVVRGQLATITVGEDGR